LGAFAGMIHQPLQGFRFEQRHVPGQQNDDARRARQRGFCLEQGMTRAELKLLECERDVGSGLQGRSHGVGLMSDHDDDRRGRDPAGGAKHVLDQRQSGGRVKDFRQPGFHPRALARGKDHQVEWGHRLFRPRLRAASGASTRSRNSSVNRSGSRSGSCRASARFSGFRVIA